MAGDYFKHMMLILHCRHLTNILNHKVNCYTLEVSQLGYYEDDHVTRKKLLNFTPQSCILYLQCTYWLLSRHYSTLLLIFLTNWRFEWCFIITMAFPELEFKICKLEITLDRRSSNITKRCYVTSLKKGTAFYCLQWLN